jgi:hypothetical protein
LTTYKVEIDCIFMKKPWLVTMSGGSDPVFTFTRDGWRPWKAVGLAELAAMNNKGERGLLDRLVSCIVVNPWIVRDQLFNIEKPTDALAFLREFGVWRYSRFAVDESSSRFPIGWAKDSEAEPLPLTFSDLMYQRDFFESALSHGPSEWVRQTRATGMRRRATEGASDAALRASTEIVYLFGGSSLGLEVNLGLIPEMSFPGPFFGRVTCHEIQDALRATILLDWMEGREWPKCKECGKRFKRTSKHPQIYCGSRCSSKVRQERFRNSDKQQPKTNKRGK